LSTIYWLNTEETLKASKSANETANGNSLFQKSLQIKVEMHHLLITRE